MTYSLFYQLHYICSNQKNPSAFLEKLEHMSEYEVMQVYATMQTASEKSSSTPDVSYLSM